jgi:hypothetical protein
LEREEHKFSAHQNEQTRKDSDGSEISVESYTYSDLIHYYDTEDEKDSQSLDHQPSEGMSSQNAKMVQVGNSGTDDSNSRFVKISRSSQGRDKDYEEIIANLLVENKRHIADKKRWAKESKRYQDKMKEWKSKYEKLVAEFGKRGKRGKNRHI